MAKTYEEPFPDTKELFDAAILNGGLTNVNIHVCVDNSLKEIYKVTNVNDYNKHLSGYDVTIFLNESVFDQLTEEQRKLQVDDSLASISYDMDKGKMVINKPDVKTFSGILSKYSFTEYDKLRETIKSIYDNKKQEEDEIKATAEKAKKTKQY